MAKPADSTAIPSNDVLDLLTTALDQASLSGISEMLRRVAEISAADGCILWEVIEPTNRKRGGHLAILADWFREPFNEIFHTLDLQTSETGKAIKSQRTVNIGDVSNKQAPLLDKVGIKTFCIFPIVFNDGAIGALNVYRKRPVPLSPDDISRVEMLAPLIPLLFKAVQDRVSVNLVSDVGKELDNAELSAITSAQKETSLTSTMGNPYHLIEGVCKLVQETFHCIEVSVILQERNVYNLIATTWPAGVTKTKYSNRFRDGIVGYVLAKESPVRISDLGLDDESIQTAYPNLNWHYSKKREALIRETFGLYSIHTLPPLSVMAVPIKSQKQVLGVIRCSVPRRSPYYFGAREQTLLELVANEIRKYWSALQTRIEIETENRSWHAWMKTIGAMNGSVVPRIVGGAKRELILAEAVQIAAQAMPDAEIISVRMIDKRLNALKYTYCQGSAWDALPQSERERVFPVNEPSVGAQVVRTRDTYIVYDPSTDPYYRGPFKDTKHMLTSPIIANESVVGVLDIRWTKWLSNSRLLEHSALIAGILGRQIGLYYEFAEIVSSLSEAQEKIRTQMSSQLQAAKDLDHQFRTPIINAQRWVESALDGSIPNDLQRKLFAIRGNARRMNCIALGMALFSDLAQNRPIKITVKQILIDELMATLINIAMDTEFVTHPNQHLSVYVDRVTFDTIRHHSIEIDPVLIEEAVSNITDNAAKYSYPNTKVRIFASVSDKGRLHISVTNKGLPIPSENARRCLEYGWRAPEAEWVTDQGSGIGLWLVDKIMEAHKGSVEIVPRNQDNLTEVKLIFPPFGIRKN